MKPKILKYLFLFIFSLGFVTGYAQEDDFKQRRYRPAQADFQKFVKEAYGDKANELVFDRPSRLKTLKNLFANSFIFVENSQTAGVPEYFPELSMIPLMSTYNPSLTRTTFNPATFNPFKYEFNFYSKERQFFHVDGTNYYIIIEPFVIRN